MKKKKSVPAAPEPEAPPIKKGKKSAQDRTRETLGLPPVEKPEKKKRPPSEPGVVVKRKSKYQIFDYASSRVIHWAGANGFTFEQTRKAIDRLCPACKEGISDENLRYRWRAGINEKTSRPAPLSREEAAKFKKAAGIK